MKEPPPFQLGHPRTELRRQLVEAVLRGEKTATAGLLEEYDAEGEQPDSVGSRCALLGYGPTAIHRRSWIYMENLPWAQPAPALTLFS